MSVYERTLFDDATIAKLVGYSSDVDDLTSPDAVLDRLHDITASSSINVQGANRFSVKVGDWRQFEIGKSIFIHRCVPQGFVEEWAAFVSSGLPIGLMTARMCLAPFTWAELFKRHDLTGSERRTFELGQKYGMRDGFWCPIGGRWAVLDPK